jgi:hypothetical protein
LKREFPQEDVKLCTDHTQTLSQIELNKPKIRVVITGGNIIPGPPFDNSSGADIVRRAHEVGIIAIGYPLQGRISGADFQCTKHEGPDALIPLVRQALNTQ